MSGLINPEFPYTKFTRDSTATELIEIDDDEDNA